MSQASTTFRTIGDVVVSADGLPFTKDGQKTLCVGSGCEYRTITQAKLRAQSGDLIVVYPGTYTENDLLKNGVNYFFHPGATVSYTDPGSGAGYGIFDDRSSGACVCTIGGHGNFLWSTGVRGYDSFFNPFPPNGTNFKGLFVMTNAGSDITFHGHRLTIEYMTNLSNPDFGALYLTNGKARIIVDAIEDTYFSNFVVLDPAGWAVTVLSTANGIFWTKGEHAIRVNHRIQAAEYCIWPTLETGDVSTSNLWVQAGLLENNSSLSTIYYSTSIATNSNNNWRTWIQAHEIRGASSSFAAVTCNVGGKHYLVAEKIGCTTTGDAVQYNSAATTPGEMWVSAQKLSPGAGAYCVRTAQAASTGTLYLNVLHYEAQAGGIYNQTGATMIVAMGGFIKSANGFGIKHTAGSAKTRCKGMHVDTTPTNAAGNRPIDVSAAGLILDGCTLVAPALAESMGNGTATVKVYNAMFANSAKNATVTIQVGTLTVDANVV